MNKKDEKQVDEDRYFAELKADTVLKQIHDEREANVAWQRGADIRFHDELKAVILDLAFSLRQGDGDTLQYMYDVLVVTIENMARMDNGTFEKLLNKQGEQK